MNKPVFLRRLDAVVVAFSLAGCITVGEGNSSGGGDECNDDNDCDNGQVCNDGDCESPGSGGSGGSSTGGSGAVSTGGSGAVGTGGSGAVSTGGSSTGGSSSTCTTFCDWALACEGTAPSECLSGCQSLWAGAGTCRVALDSFATCVRTYSAVCATVEQSCTSQADLVVSECADCPYTNDHECDEPEGTGYCDEGTDVNDCSAICRFTNDGECDEPEGTNVCPEGTDVSDCANPCVDGSAGNTCFACDLVCDEPEGTDLCDEGTDTWDCAHYP